MCERDNRLLLFQNDYNRGTAVTRNTGLKRSSGEYILILDADDLLTPWAISHLLSELLHSSPSTNLCFGHTITIDEDDKILPTVDLNDDRRTDENSIKTWIMRNIVGSGSGVLFYRDLLNQTGYFAEPVDGTTSTGCDDWIFYLSAKRFTDFLLIPSTTIAYRSVSDAQSQNTMSMWRSHKRLIRIARQCSNAYLTKKYRQGVSMLYRSCQASASEFFLQWFMLIVAIFSRRTRRILRFRSSDNSVLSYDSFIDRKVTKHDDNSILNNLK